MSTYSPIDPYSKLPGHREKEDGTDLTAFAEAVAEGVPASCSNLTQN